MEAVTLLASTIFAIGGVLFFAGVGGFAVNPDQSTDGYSDVLELLEQLCGWPWLLPL